MSRNNHLLNIIYIHDLDSYAVGMHNCLSFPFDKILAKGFNTRQTDIRPANSINTAFQLVAVCFQLQSLQQFGGVSATHLDWTMVPFVRKSFLKHYIVAWIKDNEEFQDLNLIDMLFDNYEELVENNLRVYRNKSDHLSLKPKIEEQYQQYWSEDTQGVEESQKYFVVQQRLLDSFLTAIMVEMAGF